MYGRLRSSPGSSELQTLSLYQNYFQLYNLHPIHFIFNIMQHFKMWLIDILWKCNMQFRQESSRKKFKKWVVCVGKLTGLQLKSVTLSLPTDVCSGTASWTVSDFFTQLYSPTPIRQSPVFCSQWIPCFYHVSTMFLFTVAVQGENANVKWPCKQGL